MWNLDSGKDTCPRCSVPPDLALSSSFISHTLHRPLPPLCTHCQSPPRICQTFRRAPSVSCQPLGTGSVPCKKSTRSAAKLSCTISLLKSKPCCDAWVARDIGKAVSALRWLLRTPAELCCHPSGIPHLFNIHPHLYLGLSLDICIAL